MGLFSRFKKEKKEEPKRSESILTPEAQADQEKMDHRLNPEAATAEEKQEREFEELKNRIYPILRPANTPTFLRFEAGGRNIDIPLPCLPFLAATRIFFAEDTGPNLRVLQKTSVPDSVTPVQLLSAAVRNLGQKVPCKVGLTKDGVFVVTGASDFISSYILIPVLWKKFAEKNDDSLIIAAPVREMLLFIPAKKREELLPVLAKMCVSFIKDPQHRLHPLTPLLFYYDKETGKLTTYAVSKDGSAHAAAPKAEPNVSNEEFPAEPLQEEIPKTQHPDGEPSPAGPPHLHIVPPPEPEEDEDDDDDI